jgi:predicted AlkP superfamily pyrophosphatase or phosphodiesterase
LFPLLCAAVANVAVTAITLLTPCLVAQAPQHPLYGSAKPAPDMIVNATGAPNNAHAMKQHYVVLVSLDGFRYDYPEEHGGTNLQRLGNDGARATQGMLPSYPSLTFPNHWTIVTGLRPEHHGIVRNSFYDPERKETYKYSDSKFASDGTWYGGVPLWSLAEQQGMRAATFMWPGSEAEIAGHRPDSYAKFEDQLDGHVGLDQIDAWLKLPAAERPHLITFYMPTTDHAGHWYGPDSVEETTAVHQMDALIGELRKRLDASGLPVDLVVLADHGMVRADPNWINFDEIAPSLKTAKMVEWAIYADNEEQTQKIYEELKAANDPRFSVYRRKDVPAELHYRSSARIGDPVIVPNGAYIGHQHANTSSTFVTNPGDHGYDPARISEMKAVFVANGPDIRQGVSLPVFPNVDVYSFIAKLLDLKVGATDGELGPLKDALKK